MRMEIRVPDSVVITSKSVSSWLRRSARFLGHLNHHLLIALLILQMALPVSLYADPGDGDEDRIEGSQNEQDNLENQNEDSEGDLNSSAMVTPLAGDGFAMTPFSLGSVNPLQNTQNEIEDYLRALESSTESTPAPEVFDTHEIKEQRHDVYETTLDEAKGEWKTTLVQSVRLGERSAISNPKVPLASFDNEIVTVFDKQKQELRFERWVMHKASGAKKLTDSHVFENVELTTEAGNHEFIRDANIMGYASTEGFEVLFVPLLKDLIFKSSIPVTQIAPAASQIVPNAKVTKIEFLTPNSTPTALYDSRNGAELDGFEVHNVGLTVRLPQGEDVVTVINYKRQLMTKLAASLLVFGLEVQTANGDLELEAQIQAASGLSERFDQTLQRARQQTLENAHGGSDLQVHALAQIGREMNLPSLFELLLPDSEGKNAFDTLIQAPGISLSQQNWAEWNARKKEVDALTSELEREYDLEAGELSKSWRQIVVDEAKAPSRNTREGLAKIASLKRQELDNRQAGVLKAVRNYLTKGKIAVLATCIGVDTANIVMGEGQATRWALSGISRIFSWTQDIAYLKPLTDMVGANAEYFHNTFALTSILGSLAVVLSLRPISYFVAQKASVIRGERNEDGSRWSRKKAFFSYGLRAYAWGNFPIQSLVWKTLLRQHNLYHAMSEGMSYTDLRAYNVPTYTPWWSKERGLHILSPQAHAKQKEAAIAEELENQATRKQKALVIAASIVSEYTRKSGNPIDPANLLMLFQASESGVYTSYVNQLHEAGIPEVVWSNTVSMVYHTLSKVASRQGELETSLEAQQAMEEQREAILAYAKAMRKVADSFNRDPKGKSVVRAKAREFMSWTSKRVIPFIFFGAAQYEVWFKYKNAVIDDRNADTAAHQFDEDYAFSAGFYAVTDPKHYSQMAFLQIAAMAEILANQTEQVFIYGVQGGIDNVEVNQVKGSLMNTTPALSFSIVDRTQESEQGREQTMLEGSATLFRSMFNPDEERSLLGTHLTRMRNSISGIQVRTIAGLVPRAVALLLIGYLAVDEETASAVTETAANLTEEQKGWAEVPYIVANAFILQVNTLFNKLAIVYNSALGFSMGYAAIWAAIIYAQNVIKDRAEEGRTATEAIDHFFFESLRAQNQEAAQMAVLELQMLYGKKALPAKYSKPSHEFSLELAESFARYSQANPPTPTVVSKPLQQWMNRAGALISTILYVALSNKMYASGDSAEGEVAASASSTPPIWDSISYLTESLAFFGVTFVAAKYLVIPAGQTALSAAKSVISSCVNALVRQAPVTEQIKQDIK